MNKNKKILMIAFHFPPQAGSSGILRTLNFAKNLPNNGWDPIVLSANPRAYEECREDLLKSIPKDIRVIRAFALDAARHLSIRRKYLTILAIPDRWSSWWLGAVCSAIKVIIKERPALIWSTYPIASAHLIGATLTHIFGLRWVADFRDPMINGDYPSNHLQRRSWIWLEGLVMRLANRVVFTTERAAEVYRKRYPESAKKCFVIENGYDEDAFANNSPSREGVGENKLFILHSGIIYPNDRDPTAFFEAVAKLISLNVIQRNQLCIRFRAPHHGAEVALIADRFGLGDIVQILPPIPYREAISEMLGANLLLVFQGSNFNSQIPAKIYEYLRTGNRIFALINHEGDTAKALTKFESVDFADIDSTCEIQEKLELVFDVYKKDGLVIKSIDNIRSVEEFSRSKKTEILGKLFFSMSEE